MGLHRPKTQPCRAMPLHVGSCSRLASESWLSTVFSFSFGKLWAMVGEGFTEFTAKRQKRYSTRWRSTWSKPSSIINAYRVHPSKDPTNMQLCADKWRVAQLLSCQWCNPGSHRKRDWNMMRLNSPSLTFVSILYHIYISYYILFCFIHKSSISDTILNFLNPWFTCIPNFRSPREPRIFVAQFFVPEDGHKMFSRRPFQGMKPDHQHIKSVKKERKNI